MSKNTSVCNLIYNKILLYQASFMVNFKPAKINVYLLPLAIFFILISTAATNFFTVLTVLVSFIVAIKNKSLNEIIKQEFFFKICFLIFSLFLISSLYTIAEPEEIINTLKKYIKIMYIPFIYYYIKRYKNEKKIINFFISGVTIVLILSYIKYLDIFSFDHFFYRYLQHISFSNINHNIIVSKSEVFQNYIINGIVMSFYSILCLHEGSKNNNYLLYLLSLISFIHVIFINDSRTAYIIILIFTLFTLYKLIKNMKVKLVFSLLFFTFLVLGFSNNFEDRLVSVKNNVENINNGDYDTSVGKRYIWAKIGLYNFSNQPILGNGTGSFYQSTINYFKKHNYKDYSKYITNNPHSEIISISSQLGALGLILFFIFLYQIFASNTSIMSLANGTAVLVSSLFNSIFYDNIIGLFFVIMISLYYKSKKNNKI